MDKQFLDKVKSVGSPYLVKFVQDHRVNGPEQLVQLLERHAGMIENASQELGGYGKYMSRLSPLLPQGVNEHDHVKTLIGQVKQAFSL